MKIPMCPDAVTEGAEDQDDRQRELRKKAMVARVKLPDVSKKSMIIFDADGTLRRCTVPNQPCPNKPGEWEVIPGVREKIATLPESMRFAIVSNQGGVGLGMMTQEVALSMLRDLSDDLFKTRCAIFACLHAPLSGCICRKPSPMMIFEAMEMLGKKRHEALYVGDMDSDCEAAERAGIDFMWAWEFFGWPEPSDPHVYRPRKFA